MTARGPLAFLAIGTVAAFTALALATRAPGLMAAATAGGATPAAMALRAVAVLQFLAPPLLLWALWRLGRLPAPATAVLLLSAAAALGYGIWLLATGGGWPLALICLVSGVAQAFVALAVPR